MHDLYSMKDNQQVSLKYMGDNLVLILGLCKEQVHNLCTAKEENFLSIFKSIQSWNNSIVSTSRLVWLKCYGVPISLWNANCFSKLFRDLGELLLVDQELLLLKRVDFTRILVSLFEDIGTQGPTIPTIEMTHLTFAVTSVWIWAPPAQSSLQIHGDLRRRQKCCAQGWKTPLTMLLW
ncbi:hypothetical protein D0Y65_048470 [Glycine soja]|uniref:Uncharacterized protein n=1 Tax=Glycine soja TaxID=3848 RepID=A0A445FT39_GLYSO|nr:hypothetical protein D0Y65_048470 [Glycine soja]